MNTKIVMLASSLILGATGLMFTFIPDLVLHNLDIEINPNALLLVQVIGGLYFGFCLLNWITRESLIGGIYNRPIVIANFTHFLIAGLAIDKSLLMNHGLPKVWWTAGVVYTTLSPPCLFKKIIGNLKSQMASACVALS